MHEVLGEEMLQVKCPSHVIIPEDTVLSTELITDDVNLIHLAKVVFVKCLPGKVMFSSLFPYSILSKPVI